MILNYLEGVKYYFKFSTIIFDIVTRLCLCYTGAIMKQTLLVAFMAAFLTSNPTVKPDANPSKCNEASDKKSVPSVVILNDSKAAAEAPQHNQEAPKWYRTIEWANWALVFVGVLTGYAVWRQTKQTALAAKATREAADATKDAAKAALLNAKAFINSERPWIIGSPSMPKLERPKDLRVILVYASSVKNIGNYISDYLNSYPVDSMLPCNKLLVPQQAVASPLFEAQTVRECGSNERNRFRGIRQGRSCI